MIQTSDLYSFIGLAWFLAELCFAALMYYAAQSSLNSLTTPLQYQQCPGYIVKRILANMKDLKTYTLKNFFEGWFCDTPFQEIGIQNVREFLAWAMYASFYKDLSAGQHDMIENAVLTMQTEHNIVFTPGYNSKAKHVSMTLEPLQYIHCPLIIYILIGVKNIMTDILLFWCGYRKLQHGSVKYWHRLRPARAEKQTHSVPAVFFHGITPGWAPYLLLVYYLSPDREIFMFDLDAIKIHSLNFRMPSPERYCGAVTDVLTLHGVTKVNLIGHSFGTITAGWFVRAHPEIVSHMTLIDPVSLLLSHPEVAYNFLYRKPSTIIQWAMYIFASREITIANALRRNFWWYRNELWLEDVHPAIGVHVSLAGGDEVCNSDTVREYVELSKKRRQLRACECCNDIRGLVEDEVPCATAAEITLCYRPDHSHAQILLCMTSLQQLRVNVLGSQQHAEKKWAHSLGKDILGTLDE